MRTLALWFLFGVLLLQAACGGGGGPTTPAVPSPPTNLRYGTNPAVYRVGTAITANAPASDGGAVVSYNVVPALPSGLAMSVATGVITGTPTAAQTAKVYSIAAINTGGNTLANLTLTILDLPPANLTYSANPVTYQAGTAITPNPPANTGGAVVSYSVSPALPAGLNLDTGTGVISGTPGGPAAIAGYTVTATNSGGSTTVTLTLTVTGTQIVTQDLHIAGAYLVQSSQDPLGSVPLVAGRDALLRVFTVAKQANTLNPLVHVEMRNGTTTVWAQDLHATAVAVPLTMNEANFSDSCNVMVLGTYIQPGYTLSATVDPNNAILETDKSNNNFTFNPSIQAVKVFKVTLVPITQQNLTGNVNSGRTLASWPDRLQRMYPIQTVDVALAASGYTTALNLNTADSTTKDSSGWDNLLLELEQKRVVEAADRYYFGVVNVSYTGGTAGDGYRPNNPTSTGFRTALGWDKTGYQDGGNYPEVMAHEVGHNFGRYHAPCGSAANIDANWPTDPAYANAHLGVWGWDPKGGAAASALKNPATVEDIMSYCSGSMWVSDYTYKGVLAWRAASPLGLEVLATTGLEECLVVSGTVRNGQVELGPSFQVLTRPTPVATGPYALTLHDGNGSELRRVAFAPTSLADPDGGQTQEHFVLAIPVNQTQRTALRRIRVERGDGFHVERSSAVVAREPREPVATALGDGQTYLSWDHGTHPFVLVRDAATGEVLSMGQGGAATVATSARTLELTLSDGVRSGRRTLTVLD